MKSIFTHGNCFFIGTSLIIAMDAHNHGNSPTLAITCLVFNSLSLWFNLTRT